LQALNRLADKAGVPPNDATSFSEQRDRQSTFGSSAVASALAKSSEHPSVDNNAPVAESTAQTPVVLPNWLLVVTSAGASFTHACFALSVSLLMFSSNWASLSTAFTIPLCVAVTSVSAFVSASLSLAHARRLAMISSTNSLSQRLAYRLLCCASTLPSFFAILLAFFIFTELRSNSGMQINAATFIGTALCDIAVTLALSVDLATGVIAARARIDRREWRALVQARAQERWLRQTSSINAQEWATQPLLSQSIVSEVEIDHAPLRVQAPLAE